MVEGLLSDSFVSIRLLNADDNRLWYVATGGLPSSYVTAFDGVTVGPTEGSCGTAAHRNEPVIVTDIDEDPAGEPRRARESGRAQGRRKVATAEVGERHERRDG